MKKEYDQFKKIRNQELKNINDEEKVSSKKDFESVFTFAKDGQQGNVFEENDNKAIPPQVKVQSPEIVVAK